MLQSWMNENPKVVDRYKKIVQKSDSVSDVKTTATPTSSSGSSTTETSQMRTGPTLFPPSFNPHN